MHVLRTITDNDPIYEIRVILRLAEVVRELDAIVDPLNQPNRLINIVKAVLGEQRVELGRLGRQAEADLLREPVEVAAGDAKIEHLPARINRLAPILPRVGETR